MFELNFKKLNVWKKAKDICLLIYEITKQFSKEEIYGLTSQIRRAVISIPSNIAEGYAKSSSKENLRFIEIAYGSYYELITQMEIANCLGYIKYEKDIKKYKELIDEVGKLLYGYKKVLLKSIENKNKGGLSSSTEL